MFHLQNIYFILINYNCLTMYVFEVTTLLLVWMDNLGNGGGGGPENCSVFDIFFCTAAIVPETFPQLKRLMGSQIL